MRTDLYLLRKASSWVLLLLFSILGEVVLLFIGSKLIWPVMSSVIAIIYGLGVLYFVLDYLVYLQNRSAGEE